MADDSPLVLIVEDEPLLRLFGAELLQDAGYRVIEAVNAAEALTILGAGLRPAVLLTDVEMPPGMTGYELAQDVHRRWPEIEILITSGRQWPSQGDLPAGATFLAKPCPNDVLLLHVRAAVDRASTLAGRTAADPSSDERDGVVPLTGISTG